MKKLFKTLLALFFSLCLLYTSSSMNNLANTIPLYESQVTPYGYDESINNDDSIY